MEDTHHFLIRCPFYNSHRDVLLAKVESILQRNELTVPSMLELLLYRHPSLVKSDNRDILVTTLNFIEGTNRFAK